MDSCGKEIAESAVVPEKLALLMNHVAENMSAHAQWVGTSTEDSLAEHDALLRLAADYRAIAACALTAATTMRAMRTLRPVEHDPTRWDRLAFTEWMKKKIQLQTEFANLLLAHAEGSKAVVGEQAATVAG